MAHQKIVITDFSGAMGSSIGAKKDVANAARFVKGLQPFEDPTYVTLARATTKVSGSTVTGLVKWAVDGSPWDTNRYFYDADGVVYKETSGGTWSVHTATDNFIDTKGQGLAVFDNVLYTAGATDIKITEHLTAGGADWTYISDIYDMWDTDDTSLSGNTYSVPTSITENATNRQDFVPTKEPYNIISINVAAKGTGNWTVTVHDAEQNVIGTSTLTNASMGAGLNLFSFSDANHLRLTIGNTYHYHVTSTVADGTVTTSTSSDLNTVAYRSHFSPMVYDLDFHPMTVFTDLLVIGNERYLATWDNATYNPNKIVFPPGFKVRALTKTDEYVVAACWRGQTFEEAEEAAIFFWDGISPSYNFSVPVNIGAPNAISGSKNRLFGVYGNRGSIYTGSSPFEEIVDEMPKLARGKKVEVYPGAITEFEGRTLIGVSAVTDDASGVEQGVYEFGSQASGMTEVLNFPFTLSTGTTQGTTLKIGMVQAFGKDLYIGWRDDTTYGVDKVTAGDNARTSGTWESLLFDSANPNKEMLPLTLSVTTEPLATGESITPKYKYDRATNFTAGTTVTAGSATSAEEGLYARCKEFEFGFTLASSGGTFPKVTSVVFEYDDLSEEESE